MSYRLSREQLSAVDPQNTTTDGSESGANGTGINWSTALAIIGAILLLVAIGWQVFGARLTAQRASRKPRPLRAMRRQGVQYCHECGAQARAGDRFCRECGTGLKNA